MWGIRNTAHNKKLRKKDFRAILKNCFEGEGDEG